MNFTFVQEPDGVTRMTMEHGNNIYQALLTDQHFSSACVERSDLAKCFHESGVVDEQTTAVYSLKESVDSASIKVNLCITFQKSKKVKPVVENFSFDLYRIDQDQQATLLKKLCAENRALSQRICDLESSLKSQLDTIGRNTFAYYDYDFTKKINSSRRANNDDGGIHYSRKDNGKLDGISEMQMCMFLGGRIGKYIFEHPRFQVFQHFFKKENSGTDYFYMKYEWTTKMTKYNGSEDRLDPRCSHYGMSQEEIDVYDLLQNVPSNTYFCFADLDHRTAESQKTILRFFETDYQNLVKKFKHLELTATAEDLKAEFLLRGKLLLAPNAAGQILIIEHPSDPLAVTHTFDRLFYLRNPPTAKDRVYLCPQFGFYQPHALASV